jgi:hypothetical protein
MLTSDNVAQLRNVLKVPLELIDHTGGQSLRIRLDDGGVLALSASDLELSDQGAGPWGSRFVVA